MELAHPDNQKHYALPRYGIQFEPKRIMTTRAGDIYFVVLGGGLYRYDKQTDSFIHYSQESGHLLSNYCYNVTETNSEELLVTSDKGVTFLNPFSGNTRFATLGANLPITSIADGCGILVCRNNELFVGGNDGLTSFTGKISIRWKRIIPYIFQSCIFIIRESIREPFREAYWRRLFLLANRSG